MSRGLRAILAVSALVVSLLTTTVAAPAQAANGRPDLLRDFNYRNCPTTILYLLRGSGARRVSVRRDGRVDSGDDTLNAIYYKARDVAPKTVRAAVNPYDAVGVPEAVVKAALRRYQRSVDQGVDYGLQDVQELHYRCPDSVIVPVGYSQGADVARRLLFDLSEGPSLSAYRISTSYLLGDPNFSTSEVTDRTASGAYAANSRGLFPYSFPAVSAPALRSQTYTYCHADDPVCQRGVNLGRHTNYAVEAAGIAWRITRTSPQNTQATPRSWIERYRTGNVCGYLAELDAQYDYFGQYVTTFRVLVDYDRSIVRVHPQLSSEAIWLGPGNGDVVLDGGVVLHPLVPADGRDHTVTVLGNDQVLWERRIPSTGCSA